MAPMSILLYIAAFIAVLIILFIRPYWKRREVRSLIWILLAVAWWCFFYAVELPTSDPVLAARWAVIVFMPVVSLPVLWVNYALEISQSGRAMIQKWWYLLWIMPCLVMLAVVTNPLHQLFWTRIWYDSSALVPAMVFEHGPLFWVHSAYSYILMGFGMVVFLRTDLRPPKFSRRQVFIIAAAVFVPWLANLLHLLDVIPRLGIDITPISFALAAAILAYGFMRADLLNLTPIAQDLLFDSIPDGVVILDEQSRLVNLNPAAKHLLGIAGGVAKGESISYYISEWPSDNQDLKAEKDFSRIAFIPDTQTHIELTASTLYGAENAMIGWVLILRDISQRLRMENELKKQAEQLTHVVDHVPAVLLYVSVDERLIFFNRAFVVWLGQPDEPLMNRFVRDILPEKVYQRVAPYHRRALAGERIAVDTMFENSDGSPMYVHVDLVPHRMEKGNVIAVLVLAQDITERHRIEQNEHQQRAWAEALRQTVAALNSTLEYDKVLDIILDRISVVLPHDAANIALLDPQEGVRIQRSRGYGRFGRPEPEAFPPFALSTFSNWRKMIANAQPLAIPDTYTDPDWTVLPELNWVRSYAGAPICIGDRVIGFLSLDSGTPGFFSQSHADHLMSFANEAAVAIEKARLYADVRRRADELASINRIANAITAGLDLDRVMTAILEQCQQVLPLDVFYIALYDDETELIELPLFFDQGQIRSMAARRIKENPGLTGHIIQTRQPIYIPDVLNPDYSSPVTIIHLGGVSSRCYLGVPLILRDRVIGVLSIQTYYPGAYSPDQIRLLEVIATQAAIALGNAKLYAQAQYMAITDSLTGLFNRRYLLDQAGRMIGEANQNDLPLSIILLDGDWFKRVNDTYGHLAGDQALKTIAQSCKQALRPEDVVGRFGGEEFCILLPGLQLEAAGAVAEKIRSDLYAQRVTLESKVFKISASFGIAQYLPGETIEQVLSRADAALYRAKTAGRNRIELAST